MIAASMACAAVPASSATAAAGGGDAAQAPAKPAASPTPVSIKPDADWPFADAVPGPPGDAKAWGALGALAGTVWTLGKDEVWSIAWADPGKVMRIRRAGLYGQKETVIRLGADGKLDHRHSNYGANTIDEGSAKPSGSRVALLSTAAAQIECRNQKGVLECQQRLWQGADLQRRGKPIRRPAAAIAGRQVATRW